MKKNIIIVFLGFLIYGFGLFNGFVWDIEVMFQKGGSLSLDAYFRPVMSAIYWIIANVFGARPFFFHFFQLTFHIITAILIYYLFKRFFKETISFFLALIYLVHPTSVEAVSFAMQEITFTLTGIIGLYIFVKTEKRIDSFQIFLSIVFLLVALLMKETAIVFFILVFCYLIIFKRKQTDVLVNYSVFSIIFLMIYTLIRIANGNLYVQGQGLFPIMRVSLAIRLINIPKIVLYYLSKFFYPINLAIAQHWVIKFPTLSNFFIPLFLEILLFLSAIIYSIKKKNKTFFFFFLWFVMGLLPHLQIVPLNMTVAERWLYFPMIGLLGMIGSLIGKYSLDPRLHGDDKQTSFPRRRESSLLIILAIIAVFLFSIRSFVRVLDWRNGLTLFGHDIKKDSNFDLQNNFGTELYRAGQYNKAKKYFEISTKLAPYWWVNWNNLGVIYEREKNYQKAAEYYQKAIDNGQYYLAYENLAKILVLHGKNSKKTEEFLKKTLILFPENQNLRQINAYFQEKINR